MQRQKRILYQRLRVPPAVNQFTKTLQNNQSKNLWRLWPNTLQRLRKIKLPDLEMLPKTRLMEKKPIPRS